MSKPDNFGQGTDENKGNPLSGSTKTLLAFWAEDSNTLYVENGDRTAWVSVPVGSNLGSTSLSALTDVDTTTTPPTNGQVLTYNNATSKWIPGASNGYTNEMAQDAVASMLTAGSGITMSYDDTGNTFTVSSAVTQYTDQQVKDILAATLVAGSNINISTTNQNSSIQISSTQSISTLADVVHPTNPSDGQGLIWNSSTSKWVPGYITSSNVTSSINALTDVDTATSPPSTGQALVWNNSSGNWMPGTPVMALGALSNVNAPSPTDGQVLSYNSATSKWVPVGFAAYTDEMAQDAIASLLVAGTGITLNYDDNANQLTITNTISTTLHIDDLVDVDTSTNAPTNGQMLVWNSSLSLWKPTTVVASTTLATLTDVNISSPTDGQVLTYNSSTSKWIAGVVTNYTNEMAQDAVASMLTAGSGITMSYNDNANTFTISSSITQYTDELAQDAVASMMIAGSGISLSYNDAANQFTVASTVTQYTDELAQDAIASLLVAGSGIGLSYNDAANQLTVSSSVTQYTDEMAQDAVAAMLTAGIGVSLVYNDSSNSLTISTTGSGAGASIVGGTGISITTDSQANTLTISSTIVEPTIDTDGTFAANSDAVIPSQKAVKTYVDTQFANKLIYAPSVFWPGVINTASQTMMIHTFVEPCHLPANASGSKGRSSVAANADTTFTISKSTNNAPDTWINIGTIVYSAATKVATFSTSGTAYDFSAGDNIRIVGPTSPDAMLADINFTMLIART